MKITPENASEPEPLDDVRGDDYIHLNSPGTYALREAPWRHRPNAWVNPDSFRFGVSTSRFQAVLSHVMVGLGDPESQLRGLLAATFDFAESDPNAFETILTMHHAELIRGTAEPTPLKIFTHVMHDGMQDGVFCQNDPALAAAWVVALVQRTVVLARSGRFEGAIPEIRTLTVDAAVRLVKSPLDSGASLDPWAGSDQDLPRRAQVSGVGGEKR